MSVIRIVPLVDHESYMLGSKMIRKDMNGNYITPEELTVNEQRAWCRYRKLVIDNPSFKKHCKAQFS